MKIGQNIWATLYISFILMQSVKRNFRFDVIVVRLCMTVNKHMPLVASLYLHVRRTHGEAEGRIRIRRGCVQQPQRLDGSGIGGTGKILYSIWIPLAVMFWAG